MLIKKLTDEILFTQEMFKIQGSIHESVFKYLKIKTPKEHFIEGFSNLKFEYSNHEKIHELYDGDVITFNKKISLTIKMDEPFQTFDPIEHNFSYKGVSLFLKITSPSEFIIECNYEFVFDYVFIDKENFDNTNEILTSFKKIINEPILKTHPHLAQ